MSKPVETNDSVHMSPEDMQAELERRGHVITSWDKIGSITLPTQAVTSMYRVGLPNQEAAPAVFKVFFPPGCTIEPHTHDCDYSEIILEGSQKVGNKWLYPGDIRVGLANKGYGPLVAGPDGVSVLVIFANGRWPALTLGKTDGSTLGTEELTNHYTI